MDALTTLTSRTVVLPIRDIDTDQIIPARFLTTTVREGLGDALFHDLRYDQDGRERTDFPLNDPGMRLAAHVCYGFNPNAKLGFATTEDERVWGSTEWGFGYQGPMYSGGKPRVAASHIDGVSLDCTVTADGVEITKDGEVVHPELIDLAKKLGH